MCCMSLNIPEAYVGKFPNTIQSLAYLDVRWTLWVSPTKLCRLNFAGSVCEGDCDFWELLKEDWWVKTASTEFQLLIVYVQENSDTFLSCDLQGYHIPML